MGRTGQQQGRCRVTQCQHAACLGYTPGGAHALDGGVPGRCATYGAVGHAATADNTDTSAQLGLLLLDSIITPLQEKHAAPPRCGYSRC